MDFGYWIWSEQFFKPLFISRIVMISVVLLAFYGISTSSFRFTITLNYWMHRTHLLHYPLNSYGPLYIYFLLFQIICLFSRVYFSYIIFSYYALIKWGVLYFNRQGVEQIKQHSTKSNWVSNGLRVFLMRQE